MPRKLQRRRTWPPRGEAEPRLPLPAEQPFASAPALWTAYVPDARIAKRLELAHQHVLTLDTIPRRADLKGKPGWPSVRHRRVSFF